MKCSRLTALYLGLIIAAAAAVPAESSDSAVQRMDKSAQEAFINGDYHRATGQWTRLLDRLNTTLSRTDDKKELTEQVEATQRHLGECALAEKNYDLADDYFGQARSTLNMLGENDSELDTDQRNLMTNYRLVDLNNLGGLGPLAPIAMAALGEFRPSKVSVARLDNGHHICIALADDVNKPVGRSGVTEVGISKKLSFDLAQGNNGEIALSNIVGVKVHATVWVNIIAANIQKDEMQRPIALVTAQKMGISQSVRTPVPQMIYLPVIGLVSQVKSMFNDAPVPVPTMIASPTAPQGNFNNVQTGVSGTVMNGGGYGIAPVWNTGQSGNLSTQGQVIPLPAAQTQYQQQQFPLQPQYQQQQQYQQQPQYQQQQ